ncbi:secretory carrier membrane protein 2 [Moniliophthora roreri MCA 2997]|uniref:Secretory carrier membrane protein 2 n=2 Tax=Moniliophthora roreri TaxID=221103 RepID=V2XPT7_MONRO|nr:secretory carrier membrane protein 2 [Moniliophthora roreri MCA 2997]
MSDYNQNPFASSHSLDANPFEDPQDQHDAKMQEIRAREEALQRRETELRQREEHVRNHGRKNWPPFFPLIYHDIPEEIPEASRPLITRLYQLWLVLLGTLVINMIACIFILISGSSDGGRDVGSSIGYLFVISITSFLLWYRPIYNGYMKEQALYYYLYFFFCGFHLLFSVYMIIGIPSTGSAGLIQTVQMFVGHHWAAAVLGLVASIGWLLQGLGNAFYYRQIYAHHTAAGHTMEKAKTELATHGAKAYFTRG